MKILTTLLLLVSNTIYFIGCSNPIDEKLLKGRINYASSDSAARIIETNKGAQYASSILKSSKDSYMMNLCSFKEKYVIIELREDIRIDLIVLANYEYFNSMFKDFTVSVAKRYPPENWTNHITSGNGGIYFRAENAKREQYFKIDEMSFYARYLRLDFSTHYGQEYYCLLSSVQVYGKTMKEDFEDDKIARNYNNKYQLPSTHTKGFFGTSDHYKQAHHHKQGYYNYKGRGAEGGGDHYGKITDLKSLFDSGNYCFNNFNSNNNNNYNGNLFQAIYDRLESLEQQLSIQANSFVEDLEKLKADSKRNNLKLYTFLNQVLEEIIFKKDDDENSVFAIIIILVFFTISIVLVTTAICYCLNRRKVDTIGEKVAFKHAKLGDDDEKHAAFEDQKVPDYSDGGDGENSTLLLLDDYEADLIDATYINSPPP